MTHSNSISVELPKPDKRYRPGKIVTDKKGRLRGHPETVTIKRLDIPVFGPIEMQLNPPMVVSEALAKLIRERSNPWKYRA